MHCPVLSRQHSIAAALRPAIEPPASQQALEKHSHPIETARTQSPKSKPQHCTQIETTALHPRPFLHLLQSSQIKATLHRCSPPSPNQNRQPPSKNWETQSPTLKPPETPSHKSKHCTTTSALVPSFHSLVISKASIHHCTLRSLIQTACLPVSTDCPPAIVLSQNLTVPAEPVARTETAEPPSNH